MPFKVAKTLADRIENHFTYHPPSEGKPTLYESVRSAAKAFAVHLTKTCPESVELDESVTKLEDVVFWANAAIERHGI